MVEFENSTKLNDGDLKAAANTASVLMEELLKSGPIEGQTATQAFPQNSGTGTEQFTLAANKAHDRPERGIEPIPPWKPDPPCRWPFDPFCKPDNPPMPWDPKPEPKPGPKPPRPKHPRK